MREFQKRNRKKKRHDDTHTCKCEYLGREEKEASINECNSNISALYWVMCDEWYIMPRIECATWTECIKTEDEEYGKKWYGMQYAMSYRVTSILLWHHVGFKIDWEPKNIQNDMWRLMKFTSSWLSTYVNSFDKMTFPFPFTFGKENSESNAHFIEMNSSQTTAEKLKFIELKLFWGWFCSFFILFIWNADTFHSLLRINNNRNILFCCHYYKQGTIRKIKTKK